MIDHGQWETDILINRMHSRIDKIYSEVAVELEKKLNDYMGRYKVKDAIKREMLQRGEITKAEYDYWRTGQIMIGKRWEEMKDTIAQDLHNANNLARSVAYDYMPEVYALNHNYGTFQVEKASLVDTSYTLYDRQTVERITKNNPDILPDIGPRKRAEIAAGKDIAWQYRQLQSAMTKSILMGDSIPHIAKRLSDELSVHNKNSAVRYARTAATSAQNAGRVDSYKRAEDMGIELEQEWLATLDNRTRHEHRELDGQHVKVGEKFHVDGKEIRFPGDPWAPGYLIWNCRCTLVPRLKSLDQSDAPRNSKLGSMTYDEWKNEHITGPTASQFNQVGIGQCKSVDEVNSLMNGTKFFTSKCDLTGCDLDSAKSVASAYERVFNEFPFMRGKVGGTTATDLGDSTYAQCFLYGNKRTEVNKKSWAFGNFKNMLKQYERDVTAHWHPYGTTAESIVVHELGHALDGLLTDRNVMGAGAHYSPSGKFSFHETSYYLRAKVAMSTGVKLNNMDAWVSGYAGVNSKEWFAECFAEYLTSASPRKVAAKFGEMLKGLMKDVT